MKEDYKKIQKFVETELENIKLIRKIIIIFNEDISILKDDIISFNNIKNGPFIFINQLLKNFLTNIGKNITELNDFIMIFTNLMNGFKSSIDQKLITFKEIESNLSESKNYLKNKKNEYLNCITESNINKKEISSQKDENIYQSSLKENYNQLYIYEINKIKEEIEENRNKYTNIFSEINTISTNLNFSIKDCLIQFSKNINNISESFNNLSKELITNLDLIQIQNNEIISPLKTEFSFTNDELTFEKENSQIKETKKPKNMFKSRTAFLFNKISLYKNKVEEKGFALKDETQKKNKDFISNIIKIIVGENELKSRQIIDLYNILKNNNTKQENIYADYFLNAIKKCYNHRVISLKNKNNFIHLSNIMNNICLNYKTKNTILMLIIEVSQMIKYKNEYIYKIIQKKNAFFSTKTLWLQLIDNDLIEDLNEFVDNILYSDNRNNFKDDNDDKKNYDIIDFNKKIINYKKLTNIKKKELFVYGKNKICKILSKSISGMCCFLVPEKVINEIINYYGIQFKLEYELKCYLKNIMLIKNIRIKNRLTICFEKDEVINNKIICISSVSKFFPIKEYLLFLKLNRKLYPSLKKNIILNLLSDEKISINSHLILWREYLQIDKLKKSFKYKDIKELIYISIEKDTINEELGEKSNINIIENDLLRTIFIDQNKEHFKILRTILISFLFLFPKIGYCQGMHYIILFLYQLLDYNEEETFYFFCGFEINTKYHELFEDDDFNTLKTFFKVFEKILHINWPEIYYKFIDCELLSNCYLSSWFITLFSVREFIFNKNNIPKFLFFIFEHFIIEGWSVIFNCGFSLLDFCYNKLLSLDKEKLYVYVMHLLKKEDIMNNEDFEKLKKLYIKNSKIINAFSINTLIEIAKCEEKNKISNDNLI